MGTTHIRVTDELKDELMNCKGENFTERIKNYNSDSTEQVNKNVNKDEDLEKIKSKLDKVNNKLTDSKPLTKREVDDVMSRYL